MIQRKSPLRVLHLPYRTPYERKLEHPTIEIVNKTLPHDLRSAGGFRWLCGQESFDFFDILHIHMIDFELLESIELVLQKCLREKKKVVYTALDLFSLYGEDDAVYLKKLRTICSFAHVIVALTPSTATAFIQRANLENLREIISVIPHGFIVPPFHPTWQKASVQRSTVNYALLGSFRPNRDIYTFVKTWYATLKGHDAHLRVFSTGVRSRFSHDPHLRIEETHAFLLSDPQRMSISKFRNLSDDHLYSLLAACDVLVMPYIWGSHSGQLELAFDLNLLPLTSQVGFYVDQWKAVEAYVPEPIWFHWSRGSGSNTLLLAEALHTAQHQAMQNRPPLAREEWHQYRLQEHKEMLDAYLKIYEA